MTDLELVEKKLAFIEMTLRELRELARPASLDTDVRERRFVEHSLQLAIQAALDVASHLVSRERLGEPVTNRALFELLATGDWLPVDLAGRLSDMAAFRDVIVRGHAEVDLEILKDVLANRLPDLDAFVAEIRARSA